MSSNLYKRGYTVINEEDTRIIDSNARIAKKIEIIHASRMMPKPEDKDGFSQGFAADVLDVLTMDSEEGDFHPAIDGGATNPGMSLEDAMAQIDEMKRQAAEELEQMRVDAERTLAVERQYAMEAAKKQGYQEGLAQGIREADEMKASLQAEKNRMEAEMDALLHDLEPQMIDTIAGIYEHIFHVELSAYKDIVVHLISDTMKKTEGGKDYIVHVSKDDYPYVSMQKKKLTEGIKVNSLEVIEDMTLSPNDALIETEGGIFDCSLGTQLAELGQKIRILSYEKTEVE